MYMAKLQEDMHKWDKLFELLPVLTVVFISNHEFKLKVPTSFKILITYKDIILHFLNRFHNNGVD